MKKINFNKKYIELYRNDDTIIKEKREMTKKNKKYIMNILSKKHGTIELKKDNIVVWFFRTQEGDIEVSIHNTITGNCVNSYNCEFDEQTIEKLIDIYDNYKINYKNCF